MFRVAKTYESKTISELVNLAYRPKNESGGWTHESEIVQGNRVSENDIYDFITGESIILVAELNNEIVGCIKIDIAGALAEIGMFAIKPRQQNLGLGKRLLDFAETYIQQAFNIHNFKMIVVSQRKDLLAFYQRRGYNKSGDITPYPNDTSIGTPVVEGLTIEVLLKSVNN